MANFILTACVTLCLIGMVEVKSPNHTFPVVNPTVQPANLQQSDLELAQRFAPVLYFHPDEVYVPQPVEVALKYARLRQNRKMWFDPNLLNAPSIEDLYSTSCDETCFLDQWFGDSGSSEFTNYTTHQAIYETSLSPVSGGFQPTAYAHIERNENPNHITIQYWFFYWYNDWFNKHEGDWEMIEVILTPSGQPEWTIYSQHHGGTRRSWETTPREESTHPIVFVARGSHANYFVGDELYPNGQDVGSERIEIMDRTAASERLIPEVRLIPTRAELVANPAAWPGAGWLMFQGRWGETSPQGDFSGPYGPADKGEQWEQPLAWGLKQPLDSDTWYQNRMRIEIAKPEQGEDIIWITDMNGQAFAQAESFGSLAILHTDPPDKVLAHVQGAPGTRWGMSVSWPDPADGTVTQMQFLTFEVDASGHAQLEVTNPKDTANAINYVINTPEPVPAKQLLKADVLPGSNQLAMLSAVKTTSATWDAPDLVWLGNILPFKDLPGGFFIAIFYSLLPTLVFCACLHWLNRYRKEPVRMLVMAFLWGAIPALILAFLLQLFFKLPVNQIGTDALERIQLGVLAPILEEAFKGAGVLYIYKRYRMEIDDVLDGMVYGAIVGFGFAMTANLLHYIGNFITWGYPALNSDLIITGTLQILDHGLYTAIFGAGLGFARSAKSERQAFAWVMGSLGLAMVTHALRNLISNNLVGLNAFTVILTLAGTLVLWIVGGWSLTKQRRLLRKELQGLIQDPLYFSVIGPIRRSKAQWQALRLEGYQAWREVRRLQGLCIKLAHLRLQARLFPDKEGLREEANALAMEINSGFQRTQPAT